MHQIGLYVVWINNLRTAWPTKICPTMTKGRTIFFSFSWNAVLYLILTYMPISSLKIWVESLKSPESQNVSCWKVTSLFFVHWKYATYYILHRFSTKKGCKGHIYWLFLLIYWELIILDLNLYLIVYTITINLESNNLGIFSNLIKIAWKYVFLP